MQRTKERLSFATFTVVFSLGIGIGMFTIGQTYIVSAQTNTTSMTSAMTEMTMQHLNASEIALSNNDTAAALDHITLAQLQLSMMGMESADTVSGNQRTELMGANSCILDSAGILQCRYPR